MGKRKCIRAGTKGQRGCRRIRRRSVAGAGLRAQPGRSSRV